MIINVNVYRHLRDLQIFCPMCKSEKKQSVLSDFSIVGSFSLSLGRTHVLEVIIL